MAQCSSSRLGLGAQPGCTDKAAGPISGKSTATRARTRSETDSEAGLNPGRRPSRPEPAVHPLDDVGVGVGCVEMLACPNIPARNWGACGGRIVTTYPIASSYPGVAQARQVLLAERGPPPNNSVLMPLREPGGRVDK